MLSRTKRSRVLPVRLLMFVILATGGLIVAARSQSTKDSKAAISADQAIACVRAAVAAKAGDVRAMEIEKEDGKVVCEIEVMAQDGKSYEVEIDVATNAVIEVEDDND